MNIEWLKNNLGKFYPITHARAVLFGDSNITLEEKIKSQQTQIDNLKTNSGTSNSGTIVNNSETATSDTTYRFSKAVKKVYFCDDHEHFLLANIKNL